MRPTREPCEAPSDAAARTLRSAAAPRTIGSSNLNASARSRRGSSCLEREVRPSRRGDRGSGRAQYGSVRPTLARAVRPAQSGLQNLTIMAALPTRVGSAGARSPHFPLIECVVLTNTCAAAHTATRYSSSVIESRSRAQCRRALWRAALGTRAHREPRGREEAEATVAPFPACSCRT